MIRVAVVEDDASNREEMKQYLDRFSTESGEKIHVSCFENGADFVQQYRKGYDMILMDIEMPQMDGMTAAEKIRQQDGDAVIMFVTNMPQYVMKGYTVGALDYVLKPVTYFALSQRISRALERMKRRKQHFLMIPVHGGMMKKEISKITYIEIINHDLIYHLLDETLECKGSLSEMEEKLRAEHFFRISNCYLVNLEYVEGVHGTDAVVAGEVLAVSRSRKKLLMDALNNYMNEVSRS